MKKINLMLGLLLLVSVKITAQSTPVEGTVEYDKVFVPCYNIEIPVSEDVATDAIKKRFKKMGASGKERKGFLEFKNVSIPEVKSGLVDAYVKIDRKSKSEKNVSTVSVILTEPGVAPAPASTGAATAAAAGIASVGALSLLSSLNDNSTEYGLNLEIKAQEEKVKKAEKEYKNAVSDGEDLQDKLKKVQNDIEANRNKQQQKAEEIKKQKESLLQVQSRQKIVPGEKN